MTTLWANEPIRLFHGTLLRHAAAIVRGIDLDACSRFTDFGRGFYTTTSERQARDWARVQSIRATDARRSASIDPPTVVSFTLPRATLAELLSVYFVRGDADAHDYWALVEHCRSGGHHFNGVARWYDVVAGPVARDALTLQRREVYTEYDQISFHTARAVAVLDECDKREEPWPL
jgi:hypothetical protein